MTKKQRQSRKATKTLKRTTGPAQPDEETDTASTSTVAEALQPRPATTVAEVAVESHQLEASPAPAAPVTGPELAPKVTRSETAKANIKEGLRLHQIAGRPTREQLTLVFGKSGYLLTWPNRTKKFGITPETFQAALAKGTPAVPLAPVAKPTVEKPNETA